MNHFTYVSEWNKYSKSIASQFFYQHTPTGIAIYERFVCYNKTTKYTDWCPIPNDDGWGICLRIWKPEEEVALKVLNNGCVFITRFFPVVPNDRIIMESQNVKFLQLIITFN